MSRLRASAPSVAIAGALAALAGCGAQRTAAATQPTPAAFEPSGSDAKALEVVDAAQAALGGYDKWVAVKELSFDVKYNMDGALKAYYRHSWDRWNGRHHMETANLASGAKPEEMPWQVVMYDLFDNSRRPVATYDGGPVMAEEAKKAAEVARTRLAEDAYFLTIVYKLRDPGVHLNDAGEVKDVKGACVPSCRTVKVTFAPSVGTDTWFVNFNSESKLPEVIEKQKGGGRLGYRLSDWHDAGGLKWPGKFQNLGLEGEIILYENVQIGEPEDSTYMPTVGGGG